MDLAVRLHEEGKTILVVTHDMNLAADYCDRVIIMAEGKIMLDAPVREAFQADEALSASSLRPPQVTMLGRALGYQGTWLTVDEALATLSSTEIGASHGA